jgi:hypothetical protein
MHQVLTLLGITLFCFPVALPADVDVTSLMTLTGLQFLAPGGYTLSFPGGVLATASASAQDSLGGNDANFDFVSNGSTSVSAVTALANAMADADSSSLPMLTGRAQSGVHIPDGTIAFASSSANGNPFGSLSGSFEIDGPAGTISVMLEAMLQYSQSLRTIDGGQFATSDVNFNLLLPGISPNPFLPFENLLIIGPNSMAAQSSMPTLMDTVMLQANTPYSFVAGVDAESSGFNVPEPSSLILTATTFLLVAVLIRRRQCLRPNAPDAE